MMAAFLPSISAAAATVSGSTAPYVASESFDVKNAFARAREELEAGRYAEAADEASRVLARAQNELIPGDASFAEAVALHARFARDAGRVQEVEQDLVRLRERNPPSADSLIEVSRILLGLSRPQQALRAAEEALKVEPKNSAALIAVAQSKRELGTYDEAIRSFGEALKSAPPQRRYWLLAELAETYRMAGRFEEAGEAFKAAKAADPHAAEAYYTEGYSRVFREGAKASLEEFEAVVSSHPDDPIAHHHYGAALWFIGRREQAERELKEALRLHRLNRAAGHFDKAEYVHTLCWLARVVPEGGGRFHEALKYASEARRFYPPYSGQWLDATLRMIVIYLRWPRPDRAMSIANDVLDECGRSKICDPVIEAGIRMQRVEMALRMKRGDLARADLKQVLKSLQEMHFQGTQQCGLASQVFKVTMIKLEELGDLPGAEEAGRLGLHIIDCTPLKEAELHISLGELYRRCGRRSDAVREWQAALKVYQEFRDTEGVKTTQAFLDEASPWPLSKVSCGLRGGD